MWLELFIIKKPIDKKFDELWVRVLIIPFLLIFSSNPKDSRSNFHSFIIQSIRKAIS